MVSSGAKAVKQGYEVGQSNSDIGRAGEFLAAYILETHGVEVHHVDRAGADLWCKVQDSLLTVQVKSRSKVSTEKYRRPHYRFSTQKTTADWYCFVALDRRLLLMYPVSQFSMKTARFSEGEFNADHQRRTIEEMLQSC